MRHNARIFQSCFLLFYIFSYLLSLSLSLSLFYFFCVRKQTSHKSTIRIHSDCLFRFLFCCLLYNCDDTWLFHRQRKDKYHFKLRTYLHHLVGIKMRVPFANGSCCLVCWLRFDFCVLFAIFQLSILRVVHCINIDRNDNNNSTHTFTTEVNERMWETHAHRYTQRNTHTHA